MMDKNAPEDDERTRFRAESAPLPGIAEEGKPKKD
jgi:hypothetical protein